VTVARLRDALLWTSVAVAGLGIAGSVRSGDFPGTGDRWTIGAMAIGYCVLGWLVLTRQPRLRIGWLLLAGGAIQAWSFIATWWAWGGVSEDPGSLPLSGFAAWLSVWLSPVQWPLLLVAPLVLFPDGRRVRTPGWRPFLLVIAAIVGALALTTAAIAAPVAIEEPTRLLPRSAWAGRAGVALGLNVTARVVGVVATVVALAGVVVAWRRARGLQRQQYDIVLIGVAVVVVDATVGFVSAAVRRQLEPPDISPLALMAIAAAIAVAVIRYRLFNLEVLVNRTVLVVVVGTLLAGVYALVLWGLASLLPDSADDDIPAVAAAGVVVIATAPLVALTKRASRRWFGRAADPATVAARFRDHVESGDDADAVVERLAATVQEELRLGSVRISIVGVDEAHVGQVDGPTSSLPLVYRGRPVGEVVVSARSGERLADLDRRTLDQIGNYLAVAAEAIRVGEDLRRAQRALEEAQAEERRRIRRDLHDGVGPTLASIHLRLLAHRRRLPDELSVDDIIDQTSDAIREVRRIVEGLQPSVLEDFGLVPALQILVADTRETSGIDVKISTESDLSDIPAHIATVSYRVVAEGLANVVRHSHGSVCTIHLSQADDHVNIAIEDDGCGFDTTSAAGMGLRSIANRATAAGGDVWISSTEGAGTRIAVRLPA
jgi:signal transduction histidine kinase